jgi:hypothetical protein
MRIHRSVGLGLRAAGAVRLKKHLLAAALAATGSGSAHALGFTAKPTPDYIVYAGGSSAQVNAIYWAATQLLGNVDSYTDDSGCADSGSWRILYGTTKAAYDDGRGTTIASGKAVLFMYRFAGGSFGNGIASIATGAALAYPSLTQLRASSACGGGTAQPTQQFSFSAGSQASAIPDFGLSDGELNLFNNTLNVPGSYTPVPGGNGLQAFHPGTLLTPLQANNLVQAGLYLNLVGIAATTAVTGGAHPKSRFTRVEIASILSGSIGNWNQLFADDGTPLPDQAMILLDRAPGSGTKAAVSSYFQLNPGSAIAGGALRPYNESSTGGGPTGALPATPCSSTNPALPAGQFVDFNEASSIPAYRDLQALSGLGCLAVGILGLEFAPEGQGGNYQFVAIDGADPYARYTSAGHTYASYANEIDGSYDLMYAGSFNYRKRRVNGGGYFGDATYHSVFISQFLATLGSSALPGGNSGQFPAGVPGALLDPAIADFTAAGCVARGTRFGNSLVPQQLLADATFGASLGCNDPLD